MDNGMRCLKLVRLSVVGGFIYCIVLCLVYHVAFAVLDLRDPSSFIPYHSRIDLYTCLVSHGSILT